MECYANFLALVDEISTERFTSRLQSQHIHSRLW